MLRLSDLRVPVDYTNDSLRSLILKKLNIHSDELISFRLVRRSVDARSKSDVHFVISVDITVRNETLIMKSRKALSSVKPYQSPEIPLSGLASRPLVVGAGPAGLFSALILARAGARPLLIERGKPVDERSADVRRMSESGILDPESNIQFGEGGAGAFSDGKLTCGIKSPWLPFVLNTFVEHGAPEAICYDNKPHVGTDRLQDVVASIRKEIIRLGGEVFFCHCLEEILIRDRRVCGAIVSCEGKKYELLSDRIILCIGHSARDTVQRLYHQGVHFVQKPFAIGVRIEHPRLFIDQSQYGRFSGHPSLGAASYKLVSHTPDGRGVYTFCMCPGGYVIAAASEPEGVVVNGMSYHARNADNSNSALLVGIRPDDFGDTHPLSGVELQRRIEQSAFLAAGKSFFAPAQRVEDFLSDRDSSSFGRVVPSYRPGVIPVDLRAILPDFICKNLKAGIRSMNQQLPGFAMPDAVLTAPETRSSSPFRITRSPNGEAEDISGLFPAGEGAGYAGGIVSAAVDGINAAIHALQH